MFRQILFLFKWSLPSCVKKEAHNYSFTSVQAQDLEAFESLQLLFSYYTQPIGKLCHDLPMYLSLVCASLCSMRARRSAPPVVVFSMRCAAASSLTVGILHKLFYRVEKIKNWLVYCAMEHYSVPNRKLFKFSYTSNSSIFLSLYIDQKYKIV